MDFLTPSNLLKDLNLRNRTDGNLSLRWPVYQKEQIMQQGIEDLYQRPCQKILFLGAFEKLRKATISSFTSVRLSACLSEWNNSTLIGGIFTKFFI